MAAPIYSLTLHHLSPDAKEASAALADLEVSRVTPEKLRTMLTSLAEVAAKHRTDFSVTPEIRIKTDRSELLVRARDGGLTLVSWDKKVGGQNLTVADILAQLDQAATSDAPAGRPEQAAGRAVGGGKGLSPRSKIVLLVVAVVGINAFTVWNLLKPEPGFVPPHQLLPTDEARELLMRAAGEYETGSTAGDRRLIIQADGSLILSTYGPRRTIVEQLNRSAKGADISGQVVLVTSDPSVLEIRDRDTVVLYGNVYKRRSS
ncbi:MAG: hypothetical protein KIT44_14320 [Opitutaceae bacterium]|nr:hypothetical protein [Opitutaceae bacterium]